MGLGKIIRKEDRNIDTLKEIVIKIYGVFKKAEKFVSDLYPSISQFYLKKSLYDIPRVRR